MKQKLKLLLLIYLFNILNIKSQNTYRVPIDSSNRVVCGSSAERIWAKQSQYISFVANPNSVQFISQNNFPVNLIETCGAFRLYYEDYTITPQLGFADPSLGANRRNTFCAVLNYIQSVINIPPGVTIDIFVDQSLTNSNPSPVNTSWLARAGPYHPVGGFGVIPGFYAGNVYNHINSGIDPDVNNYDCHVQVNFDKINMPFTYFSINWWDDYQNTSQTCAYDLYSILLHEMTHTMGWLSSVSEDNTTNHYAICNASIPNNGFTRFDDLFLYYTSDISTQLFSKVVSNNPIAINPAVNTFSVPLRRSNVWLYNNGAPFNQNVYSGDYIGLYNYPSAPANPGSLMSHLNDNFMSFTFRSQLSPGYQPNYVMGPTFMSEMMKREWTLPELRTLNQFGYNFNYPFNSTEVIGGIVTASVISNSPPYRTSYNLVTNEAQQTYSTSVFPERGVSDFTIPINNNTPNNPNATQIVINLSSDGTISDNQANSISVYSNSLFNIRGCGNGGNNHNSLILSNNNQTITYTPRPGFKGRAIFGFYLTDGIEKGAFKVYSVDVQNINATYLSSITSIGNNLVMNPGFEEGTEFKLRITDENIQNPRNEFYREGQYLTGAALVDNHWNNYNTNPQGYAGGLSIENSWKECNHANAGTKGNFGISPTDFNVNGYNVIPAYPISPLASTSVTPNHRYSNLYTNQNFSELFAPLQSCHRYRFSADFCFQNSGISIGGVYTMTLNFVQPPTYTYPFNGTLTAVPATVTVTSNGPNQWQNYSIDFNYCGGNSSYLNIMDGISTGIGISPKIDNISITEINPIGNFIASINNSNPQYCSTGCSVLSANLINPFCTPSYTWMPGAINSGSLNVCPTITTVYTLTTSDGCSTQTATTSVIVNTTPTLSISNTTICSGSSTTLAAVGATSYSWSTGAITPSISVSPTVTTIYTVTGTNSGCTNTKTVSVTVKTTPTVTVNSATICSGQTTTLTASGAITYSWNTSATTNSISVNPTSTTNYTVTGTTNGCSNSKTATVTVNSSPTVTAIANPTSICVGQTSTLTVSGATTYSWNTGATTTTISVSPTATTIYSVTGTTSSCSSTKTVSVIVGPATPTITASSSSVNVCSGGTATLTATGAINYTWTPGNFNTTTVSISPTVATVYTLSGSSGAGCNTATTTLLVNPVISTLCCTAANSSITTSTIVAGAYSAGTTIDVSGVITFTGNTSYTGYTFRMKPGAQLRVVGEFSLTLTNCKLYSCSELWDGIYLMGTNGDVHAHLVLNNTTIEDMYNGIVVEGNNYPIILPNTGLLINSTSSVLNKNYIAIQFRNIDGTIVSPSLAYTTTPIPFSMKTTTITSYSSSTSPGSTLKPSSTYTYAYNNITNGTMGSSAPYINFPRAFIGIKLNNLRYISPLVVGDKGNSSNTNTFDNLDFGVNAANAQLEVYNNYFKNITGSAKQGDLTIIPPQYYATGPDDIGIAIAATHTTSNSFDIKVGSNLVLPTGGNPFPRGNKFENCNQGIKAINCNNVTALANTFTASTTSLPVVTTTGAPPYQFIQPNPNTYYYYSAQSAIFATGVTNVMHASYNDINNYGNGIYCNFTSNSNGAAVRCYTNNIAASSSTGYCMQAIQVDQSGGFTTSGVDIMGNNIREVYRGIITNMAKNYLTIKQNTILVEDMAKTLNWSASSPRTGIIVSGCDYGLVQGNNVTSNAVSIPSTATTANYLTGVYVKATPNARVECNSTYHLGRDFVFEAGCANSRWLVNTMQDSYRGLEMRLSAVIGPQGGTGSPNLSANTWTTVTEETYVLATNPNSTSQLFILNNVAGNPKTLPTANYPTASSSRYQTGFGMGLQNLASGTSYTCNGGYAQRMANTNSDNNTNSGGSHQKMANTSTDSLTQYVNLATADENSYEVFADEMQYQNKQLVYQLIKQDSINPATGSTLDNFYADNQNSAIGKLTEAQTSMANYDVMAALQANSSAPVSSIVEQKYQRANELTLKYMADLNYAFTDAEKSDLYNMANECPAKGSYVSSSRNLVNVILHTLIIYNDECDAEANASRKAKPKENGVATPTTFNLFPNPNNGIMQLDYNLGIYANAKFNLFDITGKLIQTKNITTNEGSLFINEQNLENGIYFYTILVGEKNIKTDKVVIIK